MTYDIIKKNYDNKMWNDLMVKMAVKKGLITPEQYTLITNNAYTV